MNIGSGTWSRKFTLQKVVTGVQGEVVWAEAEKRRPVCSEKGSKPSQGQRLLSEVPGPRALSLTCQGSAHPLKARLNQTACPWGATRLSLWLYNKLPFLFHNRFCEFLFLNINRHWQKHLKFYKIWIYIDLERPFKIIHSNLFILRQDLRPSEITDAYRLQN